MNNEEKMKLILSPSSNLVAFAKLIEQQERMAKIMAPALTMSSSIVNIARYYEDLNKTNKSFQYPFTISDTIENLVNQNSEITNRYSKYYNQLNDLVRILNPSLALFFKNNSSSSDKEHKSLNPIDIGVISSFNSVEDDYDETTQAELETVQVMFNSQLEFKEEVSQLINESTSEISTDIYLRFSQIIEKYVGVINAKTIGLFLNLILTTYFILIPLHQNYLSSESENSQIKRIENAEKGIKSEINKSSTEIQKKLDSLKSDTEDIKTQLKTNSKIQK